MTASWLVLLLMAGGGYNSPTHDLVSLIAAEDYFKARNVAVKADEMVKLAGADPKDGKAQIQQLLAIRWLGENLAEAKKAKGARALLEEIAAGKKAQDPQGFAKLYAKQALARLDGKPIPVAGTAPGNSITEALAWFPAAVNIAGGIELRPASQTVASMEKDPLQEMFSAMVPAPAREEMYKFAEAIGNVRLDRIAVAFEMKDNGNPERIYIRFTGAANRKWLGDFIAREYRRAQVKEEKGPKGEPITLISSPQDAPAFALIGDTEMLMCGYEGARANHLEVVEKVLKVRAGKEKGVAAGPLAGLIKGVPAEARSLGLGVLSDGLRKEMLREGIPIPVVPQRFVAYMTKGEKRDVTKAGLALHLRAVAKNADEAKALTKAAEALKQQGLKHLDNLPPGVKLPPELVKAAKEALGGLKIEATKATVQAELPLPEGKALFEGLRRYFELERVETRPVPSPQPLPPRSG